MRIGEVARHAEVNVQTLRDYERRALEPAQYVVDAVRAARRGETLSPTP